MEHPKKKLTLKEIIDYLEEKSESDDLSPDTVHTLFIEPPVFDGNDSGEDDALEDEGGIPEDVCAEQLKSSCEIILQSGKRLNVFDEEEDINLASINIEDLPIYFADGSFVNPREHSDNTDLDQTLLCAQNESSTLLISPIKAKLRKIESRKSVIPLPELNKNSKITWVKDTKSPLIPIFPNPIYDNCKGLQPHEQFEKFFDDELLNHIAEHSNKYAVYRKKFSPNITIDELRVFIGILIISGYNYRTSFRSLWSNDDDLKNILVCQSMRRNRFEEILEALHFEDNRKSGTRDNPIAYFGRHGCKQFIKGKPLRFGYKVWSLCSTSGYLINFEIYQGKNPRSNSLYEHKFGKCAAPLINMIDDFSEDIKCLPFSFYFDNLFTNFPLLIYLKSCGYNATGTIRENRIPGSCPIQNKKLLTKKQRGHCESIQKKETGICLMKWVDNSVVCVASTCFGAYSKSSAARYSKAEGKRINTLRPCAIGEYNKYMCGVDRFDQNVSLYRIAYRGKKWYSCIFTWLIDACTQNAWQLHRNVLPGVSQLEFRRQIAMYYCKHYGSRGKTTGRPNIVRRAANESRAEFSLRYDEMNHYIRSSNRRRCAMENCTSTIRTECSKCNIGLCIGCFIPYHTKE